MAQSIREQAYDALVSQLREITAANGYNTQPRICADYDEAFLTRERLRVWVELGQEMFNPQGITGRFEVSCEFIINGAVFKGDVPLTVESMQLVQDIRNAVCSARTTYQGSTGAAFKGFDALATDEGELAVGGLTQFKQPVVFVYIAGPNW